MYNMGMSMLAVGEYLRVLREGHNLSVKEVAHKIDTTQNYVWKIENGKLQSPGAILLCAFVKAVKGDLQDIDILLEPTTSPEDGRLLARQRMSGTVEQRKNDPVEDIGKVIDTLAYIRDDPRLLARLSGFCEGLVTERGRK